MERNAKRGINRKCRADSSCTFFRLQRCEPGVTHANTYVGRAYRALRLPDGSYKTHAETKRICLDDEEAKYRLEFMDKSIMGITDWKAAKAAEEMFKGHWEDTNETRTYNGRE